MQVDQDTLFLVYSDSSLRSQGIIADETPEEPLLRRPVFPIVNKPNLPVVNKPVNFLEYGKLTSLRRPNLPIEERTNTEADSSINSAYSCTAPKDREYLTRDIPKNMVNGESANSVKSMESTISTSENHITKDVSAKSSLGIGARHNTKSKSNKYVPITNNKTMSRSYNLSSKDCDNASLTSDSSWASSVYEPLKRYSNKSFINQSPTEYNKDTPTRTKETTPGLKEKCATQSGSKDPVSCLNNTPSHEFKDIRDSTDSCRTMLGVGRGGLNRSMEKSAFTPVVPKQTTCTDIKAKLAVGRGLTNGHTSLPNSDEKPMKSLGRGNLKLAAINFQSHDTRS